MRLIGEKVAARVGIGLLPLIGLVACGSDTPKPKIDRTAEVARIYSELEAAKKTLAAGEQAYEGYLGELPPDCSGAIAPYIPPDGEFQYIDAEGLVTLTAEWCDPYYHEAIPKLRGMYGDLLDEQTTISQLSESLGANLGKAGVTVPPTHR